MPIVSFFDQFPEYKGQKVPIRGDDGYFDATAMGKILNKKFRDWSKTKFAQELLDELSKESGIPIKNPAQTVSLDTKGGGVKIFTPPQKSLIDYVPGDTSIFIHPYVALSYAMSDARFQARMNIWIVDLLTLGTVNPHYLKWSYEEYLRGLEFNRDDIDEMYGR